MHVSTDHKYKANLVIKDLLTRTNQLLTSGRCGNVICDDSQDKSSSVSEITIKTVKFCNGVNRMTSVVIPSVKNASNAHIPNLHDHIYIANTEYQLTGTVYFNGIHYQCEVFSTQIG